MSQTEKSAFEQQRNLSLWIFFILLIYLASLPFQTTDTETTNIPPNNKNSSTADQSLTGNYPENNMAELLQKKLPEAVMSYQSMIETVLSQHPETIPSFLTPKQFEEVILVLIQLESGGNIKAISSTGHLGASGLLQVANYWLILWSNPDEMPEWVREEVSKREEEINQKAKRDEELAKEGHVSLIVRDDEGNVIRYDTVLLSMVVQIPKIQILVAAHFLKEGSERYDSILSAVAEYNGGVYMGSLFQKWIEFVKEINSQGGNIDLTSFDHPEYQRLRQEAVTDLTQFLIEHRNYSQSEAEQWAENKANETQEYIRGFLKYIDKTRLPEFTPTPTPSALETPTSVKFTIHVVEPGETLSSIAKKYGVTLEEIIQANDIKNPNLIYPGQEIKIPQKKTTPQSLRQQTKTAFTGEPASRQNHRPPRARHHKQKPPREYTTKGVRI